ncbi:MAG TPA: large conductance mechanosensitive channel protein MscL [Lachnospiraceae bacterium]|nr:large conductance mechanosensitive channel protein MscL [Lachnospiraceae bacterium]
MKAFFDEFKKFISRGNVMDMAVGIIIGGAFTTIVNSLVDDIISPLLGCFGGLDFSEVKIPLVGTSTLNIGNFLNAVINFLLMALILFTIVKLMNDAQKRIESLQHKEKEEEKPKTKICPYCKSEIDIEATRCPHCTSELPKMEPVSKTK